MPSGLCYLSSLGRSFSSIRDFCFFFFFFFLLLLYFIESPVFNENSVDPGQMLHSVASDLSLHCLTMSLL